MKCILNATLHLMLVVSACCDASHPLHRKLTKWHTLKEDDLRFRRHKRSLDDNEYVHPLNKEISFDTFDRTFTLSLMPSPEIFSPGFKAYVQSRRSTKQLTVDKASVMTGKVLGDPRSHVSAHLNGKMLTARIETKNETYIVEPIWRHLPEPRASVSDKTTSRPSHSNDMLVYRYSDLNLTSLQHPHSGKGGFCDTDSLMKSFRSKRTKTRQWGNEILKANQPHTDHKMHHRGRRASGNLKKICKLSLVADHRFYREMGNSSTLETMYYLINLIERVNKIYKTTDWGSSSEPGDYVGYGFQIDKIIVHNESSDTPRYNKNLGKNKSWKAKDLLEAFSETELSPCLSHLFTYVDFGRGLLGLAYVGSEKAEDVGGICTQPYNKGKGRPPLYLNTGLTSTVNWGQKILTTEADLVTAHELGHNFGAEHDDDTTSSGTADCTPGQSNNGNFIMYPAAVSGQYPNNKKFSECSKHNILPGLKNKAPFCFQEDKKSFCGNYQVEADDNETCDVGFFISEDPCCMSNCTLRAGAKCSNKNHKCCTEDCQAASHTKLCQAHIPGLCLKDVYCDGVHFECPEPEPEADNKTCGDLGKCKDGHCVQFCETKGMQPCLCSLQKEEYCKRCCAPLGLTGDAMIKQCRPYIGDGTLAPQTLPDYSACKLGYCHKGVCDKQTQDVIERVWDIFKHIAPDKIGEFLADNIVGAVLVFSLLFWIPCSCLVNFVDKKRLKERKKEEKWFTERGGEYSRSSGFRGVAGGSAPNTPRIRIQRNNTNWISGGAAVRSGLGAREQWRASQERGIAVRKSAENLNDKLSTVPGSPNNSVVLSHSHPSLTKLAVSSNGSRPPFVRAPAFSLSRSHPSLGSPMSSSLSEKSFDGDMKPIAASSTTDLSLPALDDSDGVVMTIIADDADKNLAVFRRPGLHRQEATMSPQ